MGIVALTVDKPGQIGNFIGGVVPRKPAMVTTDSLATITTAGYINPALKIEALSLNTTDVMDVIYNYNTSSGVGNYGQFTVAITNGIVTLTEWTNPGNVLLPVISGDFAVFNGTSGQIKDSGSAPSAASQPFVVVSPGSLTAGNVLKASDAHGTLADSGIAANIIATSTITNPDPSSDLTWYEVNCRTGDLNNGGQALVIFNIPPTNQYYVRDIQINASPGLSGGGGNRLLALTDGANIWTGSGITAAVVQSANTNLLWGSSGFPLPTGGIGFNTPSIAGANIWFQYQGGTTDYTTGFVNISVLLQRVA